MLGVSSGVLERIERSVVVSPIENCAGCAGVQAKTFRVIGGLVVVVDIAGDRRTKR